MYYLHERPLNVDSAVVAKQIGMREKVQVVQDVLNEFFQLGEDGWVNDRADKEIKHYHSKIEQASRAGKASAEARLNKRSTTVQPTINQEPITNNQIKEAKASLSGTAFPTCPHQEILKLWKDKLPHLVQPRVWEGARQANLRQRWVQASKPSEFSKKGYRTVPEGLTWWSSFFDYIAEDTKLAKGFETNGRVWLPDLEWVVNATNFQKIIDGKYNK
jgi:uncharacterized protein YdaU (DUF1376 family)